MSDSVGKISLDLEVRSDLSKQLNDVSSTIGKRLKMVLDRTLKNGFGKSGKTVSDTMQNMTKAIDNTVSKTIKNTNAGAKGMLSGIEKTLGAAKNVMKSFGTIKPAIPKVPDYTPKTSTAKSKAVSPRGPPKNFNSEIASSQMTSIAKEMDLVESRIGGHKLKLKDLKTSYEQAFNPDFKSKLDSKIEKEETLILRLEKSMDTLAAKYSKLESAIASCGASQQKASVASATLDNSIKKANIPVSNLNNVIKKTQPSLGIFGNGLKKVGRSASSAGTDVRKFGTGIGGSLGQMFKWMIILPAISGGIMSLCQSLFTSLNANSQFASSLNMVKSNLMVAFTPIYNAILPALNSLVSALATVTGYMASFISLLFGKTFQQSFEGTKSLITAKDAMGAYGDAAKQAGSDASAAGKAAKEAQRDILGFDRIEKLGEDTESNGDTGAGNAGTSGAPALIQPPDMGALDATILPWVKKFKEIMSQIFKPFQEAWAVEGLNTISAMRFALGGIWGLIKSIGKSFLEVWTNGSGTMMLSNILIILQNIFKFVGHISSGLQEAWEKNNTGTGIIQSIFNIFNTILETIRNITGATSEWASKLDFSPLLESIKTLFEALEPFTESIGKGLEWFWNNILLPIAGWAIQTAVPTFLELFSAAIGAVNAVLVALAPLAGGLFNDFLKPLAEFTGGLFISIMQTITDLLKKFSDWCMEHQTAVQNIAIVIGAFAIAWGIVTTALTIWNSVATLATGITVALSAAQTLLAGPIGIAIVVIGALIAVGVLLYNNWDVISQKAKEVWDFVKQKFSEFSEFLSGIFTTDWTKSFGIVGEVFNAFFKNITNIWDAIKTVFSGIVDFIAGVFTGNWERAWDGVKNIFKGIFDLMVSFVKTPINAIIGVLNGLVSGVAWAVNSVASMFNRMQIKIPSWVPGIGGGTLGFNLPTWSPASIPYLAKGGVIDQPTLAMMGEDGKEAVVPLERNRQWIQRVSDEMQKQQSSGTGELTAEMVTLLKEVVLLLKTLDIVQLDVESLRKYFISTTNKNTVASGKCELRT